MLFTESKPSKDFPVEAHSLGTGEIQYCRDMEEAVGWGLEFLGEGSRVAVKRADFAHLVGGGDEMDIRLLRME